MDSRIEQAVQAGVLIAQQCAAEERGGQEPDSTSRNPTSSWAWAATRHMPLIMTALIAGSELEIINIVWGAS